MKRMRLLILILLVMVPLPAKASVLSAPCHWKARFISTSKSADQIFWNFKLNSNQHHQTQMGSSAQCPFQSEIKALVLGAEFLEKSKTYVYPQYLKIPQKNQSYEITLMWNSNKKIWVVSKIQ